MAPQRAFRAAAGKHQAVECYPGELRDLREVAGGDNRRVLFQRAEQGRFIALLRKMCIRDRI